MAVLLYCAERVSFLSPNNFRFSIDELDCIIARYYYFEGSFLFHIEIQSWYELNIEICLVVTMCEV